MFFCIYVNIYKIYKHTEMEECEFSNTFRNINNMNKRKI